jgi:hypothetical protein
MRIRRGLVTAIDAAGSLVDAPPLTVGIQFNRSISAVSAPFGLKPAES